MASKQSVMFDAYGKAWMRRVGFGVCANAG